MGKYLKGILGPFTGLVGTIIDSSWKGIDVMRSMPKKTGRQASPAQLEQRKRFVQMVAFIESLKSI